MFHNGTPIFKELVESIKNKQSLEYRYSIQKRIVFRLSVCMSSVYAESNDTLFFLHNCQIIKVQQWHCRDRIINTDSYNLLLCVPKVPPPT